MPFAWAELKGSFFDRAAVVARLDKGKRKVLGKLGAFVRTRARSSIRPRKASAAPGQPPSSHAGQLRTIFFAWDPRTQSVVAGPVPYTARRVGAGVVPRLMEEGGSGSPARGRRAHYAPHPFMGPALASERPKFREQLRALWG